MTQIHISNLVMSGRLGDPVVGVIRAELPTGRMHVDWNAAGRRLLAGTYGEEAQGQALALPGQVLNMLGIQRQARKDSDGKLWVELFWNRYDDFSTMEASDVMAWLLDNPPATCVDAAVERVFPLLPIGSLATYNRLRDMAHLTLRAIALRLKGDIAEAQTCESEIDRLYNEIPRHMRAY